MVPPSSVTVDLDTGSASLAVSNLAVEDYHDLANALKDGPSVPATVSFHVAWSSMTRRVKIRDTSSGFAGQFVENTATIAWSATEAGFSFQSDPASTSTSMFAEVGKERNGVFFPQGT